MNMLGYIHRDHGMHVNLRLNIHADHLDKYISVKEPVSMAGRDSRMQQMLTSVKSS